ncbi:helix-turn-helix transcriptional regulator [Acidithiobacillus caldus]
MSNQQLLPYSSNKDVQRLTTLSRPTIYRYIAERGFPRPKKLGARSVWITSEVLDWMEKNLVEATK